MSTYQIPFSPGGRPCSYAGEWLGPGIEPVWRDNVPFAATMTFTGFGRGRSSALLHFQNADGIEHKMFLKDFSECLKFIDKGVLAGQFQFAKRGTNYGLKFLPQMDLTAEVPVPPPQADRIAAYHMVDRYLRNNLGDEDYAEFSGALDLLTA